MKNIFLLLSTTFSLIAYAQNYNGPESVDFDINTNRYFISNSSNGQILSIDKLQNLSVFADNIFGGPHGLEVVNNTLFACSIDRLKGYDLTTGNQTVNINLNAGFANGITHKGNDVFITDFSQKKVFRYNTNSGEFNVFTDSLPSTPNGIYYDYIDDRLIVVSWGFNSKFYEISLADSSFSIVANTNLGNCDGITMDNDGSFYVSAWSNNSIAKFDHNFSCEPIIVVDNMSNPADIYYNQDTDVLAIPNSSNNSVPFISANEFSITSSWNCVEDACIEIADATGTYVCEEECEMACGVFEESYNCENNACVDPMDGSGDYFSLENCEENCDINFIQENNHLISFKNPIQSNESLFIDSRITPFQLFDLQGKVVWNIKINLSDQQLKVPMLKKGLYILKSNYEKRKIIVM